MDKLKEIAERIAGADALLIGAGNGLSITEGLHLFADNRAFEELFGDLKRRYGISCILGGMVPDGLRRKNTGASGAVLSGTTVSATAPVPA